MMILSCEIKKNKQKKHVSDREELRKFVIYFFQLFQKMRLVLVFVLKARAIKMSIKETIHLPDFRMLLQKKHT